MKTQWKYSNTLYVANMNKPLDISIPLSNSSENPSAWYVSPPRFEPVRNGDFIGSVEEGGSVNFRDVFFNPHGHGTHTECVGHISEEIHSINQVLKRFFFFAELVSIRPKEVSGDKVILWEDLKHLRNHSGTEAIIIRTLPNSTEKTSRQYSNTNPPYIEEKAIKELIAQGVKHLLIDLPSVDKEIDGGALLAHRAFWEYPEKTNLERTITELIYVKNSILDGLYLLNLQISSFENDACPSKPVLYELEVV